MAGLNAQTLGSQLEYVRPELEMMYGLFPGLWNRIKTRTDIKAVSTRPARIPLEMSSGAKFATANFDAGELGRGGAPTEEHGELSCVSFVQGSEYSSLAEYATDSSEKAIQNYVSLTQQRAAEQFAAHMNAVFQGAGDNKLDTIVSTTTNGFVVNNANKFVAGQDIDVFTAATPPVFVQTNTVLSVDIENNTVWLTAGIGSALAGHGLFVHGSTGAANSGLAGLRSYQVTGNVGTYMGISRASYPGEFSTPTIAVNGTLTPAVMRALEAKIKLAMGVDKANQNDVIAHANVDVQAAWENNAILVQRVWVDKVSRDESADMLPKNAPTQIAGRELLVDEAATPGLVDFLALKKWFRIESRKLDYHEVGGQTVFPVYSTTDGGLVASAIFYLEQMVQTGNSAPRLGAYASAITVPSGYFGN